MKTRMVLMLVVLSGLSGAFVARLPAVIPALRGAPSVAEAVDEARSLIQTRYVEPVPDEKLITGAIQGMADALKDPYTEYVPPIKVEAFNKDLFGEFVGIGATVQKDGEFVVIQSPLPGSPALAAGLRPGDRVRSINGESLAPLTLDQAISKIKGQPGTTAVLKVLRNKPIDSPVQLPEELEIRVVRGSISASPVTGFRWDTESQRFDTLLDKQSRIAYLRIDQFTGHADDDVASTLAALRKSLDPAGTDTDWLKGLIIDLRDNPGGLLDDAVDLADNFLDDGVIVSTKPRPGATGQPAAVYSAKPGQLLPGVPIAVLVNGQSASASEVFAGALSEQNPPRAIIIGTRTFGKGLVQTTEPMTTTGGILKLTEQHYYLPSGRMLHRSDTSTSWGVDPTPGFLVPIAEEQLQKLRTNRSVFEAVWPLGSAPVPGADPAGDQLRQSAKWSDANWIREQFGDPQLAGALLALQSRISTGAWTPLASEQTPAQVAATGVITERAALERVRERLERDLQRIDRRLEALDAADAGGAEQAPASGTGQGTGPGTGAGRPTGPVVPPAAPEATSPATSPSTAPKRP